MDGSGAAESENSQQDFHRYLRLVTLLNDYGGVTLRDIFRRRYENVTNKKWKDGSQTSKDFHKTVGKSVFKSAKPIQRAMLQKGDLNEWDLALLSTVLQNIDYTNGSAGAMAQHENENDAVKELAKVRNKIEHLSGKSICLNEFNILWKTVAENLVSLDVSVEEIDSIRSCTNLHGIEFKSTNENHVNDENYLKAKGLKDEGNAATRSNKLYRAIQLYTEALNLYGVLQVERGIIYSNRSSVYLKLLEETAASSEDEVEQNYKFAKEDAEKVIGLRPTWWKGYYRLGRVLQFKKEWKAAIVSFDQALGLNMGDKEILNARDTCRFEEQSDRIVQHIQPHVIQSQLDTNDLFKKWNEERRRFKDSKVSTLFKMYKFFIDSSNPELQSMGYVFFAHRHLHGTDGYKINLEKAAELFLKAAKIGNVEALFNVGYLHQHGIVKNFELAAEYFEKAAKCPMNGFLGFNKLGVVAAQYELGRCYHAGVGKPKDFVEAVRWYSLASVNGSGHASNNLGCLHLQGIGVETNLERAIQYYKLAASQGEIIGMQNLAWTHLLIGNLDEAEKWFLDSIKAGNLISTLRQQEFQDILKCMRHYKTNRVEMNTMEAAGENISDTPKLFQTFAEDLNSSAKSKKKKYNMLPWMPSTKITDPQSAFSKYWKRENEIRLKASQGFRYAKTILLSMEYFKEGLGILHRDLEFREGISNKLKCSTSTGQKMLRAFANSYRATEIVPYWTRKEKATLKEIAVETVSHFKDELSDVDCDARICYSCLISNSLEEAVNFLEVSKMKYPNEIFFPTLQIDLLRFLKKFDEALQKSVNALERFPNSVELLRSNADVLVCIWDSKNVGNLEEIMNASKMFLNVALPDHRKVPEAYYCLGRLSLKLHSEDKTEAENYLRAGIEAENKLLSCFIPYDCGEKKLLNLMLDTTGAVRKMPVKVKLSKEDNEDNNTRSELHLQDQRQTENAILNFERRRDASLNQMQQTNPMRIHVVVKYRRNFKDFLKNHLSGIKLKKMRTCKPLNKQKLPSQLTGLQEIKLDEMNPTTDHVYASKILHATIMEDCIFDYYPSIHTVFKDDNGDFILCYFYYFNQKDAETRQKFSFGSRISILNPYHRLTADLGFGIRIDDPHSVVFHSDGDENPICRFCCKPDPSERCSKCKRARYCGKHCQLQDWNILKHKFICKPAL